MDIKKLFHLSNNWEEAPIQPLRRFLARVLDTVTFGFIIFPCLLGLLLWSFYPYAPALISGFIREADSPFMGVILGTLIVSIFSTVPIAASIGWTKTTPGKLIFGLKVTDQFGNAIGFKTAFKRELLILMRGWGFGILLFALITLQSSYKHLKYYGKTSWDMKLNTKTMYREDNKGQKVLNILGMFLTFLLVLLAIILQHL